MLRWPVGVALLASLVNAVPVAAQEPPTWLSGFWTELAKGKTRAKGKGKAAAEPPGTLQVAIANGTLRIVENGTDGVDLRCQLDGTESAYRQIRNEMTLDYRLACDIGPQSVEVTGPFTVGPVDGFPPREFELRKKYEIAPGGSLRKEDQLWGNIPGLGRVLISNTTTSYSRP